MNLIGIILYPLGYLVYALLVSSFRWKQWGALFFALINLVNSMVLIQQVDSVEMLKIQVGSWEAPFGITLFADRFSAMLLLISAILFVLFVVYSLQSVDAQRRQNGYFFFAFGILVGVNGSFIAGDLFNLYVWFEVMLMSSFILISFGSEQKQLEGTIKYLLLNLVSSFFFVAGIGLLYGKMGTLNMADLSQKISLSLDKLHLLNPSLILIFIGFAIKSAMFPFFFWLPASYHTPPPAVTALFAGLLTKVGVYALIRFYSLYLYHADTFWNPLVLWLGVITMVVGVVTATSQFDMSKILSFHIISQIGYVVIALGFFTVAGLAGALFFLVHNMLSKSLAFFVGGWVFHQQGTLDLKKLGDMYRLKPIWGVLFLVAAFSLAGFPPLSGFAAKYFVLKSGLESGQVLVSFVALMVGLFTLFSMTKIWQEVFWKPMPTLVQSQLETPLKSDSLMLVASVTLSLLVVALGLWAQPVLNYCEQASMVLLSPERYIEFVLN